MNWLRLIGEEQAQVTMKDATKAVEEAYREGGLKKISS
jgi:hypothetical protein